MHIKVIPPEDCPESQMAKCDETLLTSSIYCTNNNISQDWTSILRIIRAPESQALCLEISTFH